MNVYLQVENEVIRNVFLCINFLFVSSVHNFDIIDLKSLYIINKAEEETSHNYSLFLIVIHM